MFSILEVRVQDDLANPDGRIGLGKFQELDVLTAWSPMA